MPNIVLKERDMTTIAYANETNDVVFVPGIADTNWNVWITDIPGLDIVTVNPNGTTYAEGDTIHKKASAIVLLAANPSLAVNTFDKKMWKKGESAWELMDSYVEPAPMNLPVYVTSTIDFASKFGGKPFTWSARKFSANPETSIDNFNTARILPTFAKNELPGTADAPHYFYNDGDQEISWIYANDLLYAGMPVVFEDVAKVSPAGNSGGQLNVYRKDVPKLTDFYEAMNSQKTGKPTDDDYDGTYGVFANYELLDISEYNFKYVTSGGYPVFNQGTFEELSAYNVNGTYSVGDKVKYRASANEDYKAYKCKVANNGGPWVASNWEEISGFTVSDIVNNMLDLCANRGDCYTLIDHADNVIRPWYGEKSLKYAVDNFGFGEKAKYAGMFTPWATYNIDMLNSVKLMPASFGYLRTLAKGMIAYNNYFAFAGVNRGVVDGIRELHCAKPLTNTVANDLQTKDGFSINPITYVRPYGLTLWGNRTLLEATGDLKATNFLNIRNLVCEVQKTAYQSAKVCLFENDNLGTWVKFTNPIKQLLTNMQNAGALAAFEVARVPVVEKAVIAAEIRLVPIYAVEEFWITVTLLDNGEVTVETE